MLKEKYINYNYTYSILNLPVFLKTYTYTPIPLRQTKQLLIFKWHNKIRHSEIKILEQTRVT